ncbi:hypothetical protein GQ600_4827 [Phytophthora cactorum]|nr:hypothetical protein GQ600_4827 [Phytophthora cactorum]
MACRAPSGRIDSVTFLQWSLINGRRDREIVIQYIATKEHITRLNIEDRA